MCAISGEPPVMEVKGFLMLINKTRLTWGIIDDDYPGIFKNRTQRLLESRMVITNEMSWLHRSAGIDNFPTAEM